MMSRVQVSLDSAVYRLATSRAAELGVSFAEYVRRLVESDLIRSQPLADPAVLFDLGESRGSDVARHKDDYLGDAFGASP